MKNLRYIIAMLAILTTGTHIAFAQDTTRAQRKELKADEIKKMLDGKRFTFKAQYANPLGGGFTTLNGRLFSLSPDGTGHIYLNYNYDVAVKADSVIAFLPYFGRTTMAPPIGSTDNGVKFTSTDFGYKAKTSKKGNTVITITPNDTQYTNKLILDVTSSGRATLQVISTNRTAIYYDGYIAENKQLK